MAGGKSTDLGTLRIPDAARGSGGGGRRRTWWLAASGAVLILAIAAFLLARRAPEVGVAPARASAAGSDAPTLLNASGYVTPRRRATVAAKITARVVEMLADEGMAVREGQLLATLDDSDARKRLRAAEAARDVASAAVTDLEVNLANAERELRRQRDLQEKGIATEQALDQAGTLAESYKARLGVVREQVREAEASLGIARQDVENCRVTAPFAGIVVSKDAQPGEMVSPVSAGSGFTRTGIATVVDMDSLEIEVDVNESYIAKVKPGQRVEAALDAYPDWKIPASVRTVIPTADRQKATVKVRIAFDRLDPRILPDMGVKVSFLGEAAVGGPAAARVVVPRAAVRADGGVDVVFVVRDGRAERRKVRLGESRENDVVVLAGVSEGESVIVSGPDRLEDGARVRVK